MCGRFTQFYSWAEVDALLSVCGPPQNLHARYNIAPTTQVNVVRSNAEGERELIGMRWGLVPAWWKKSVKELPSTFNAKCETIAEKPMFYGAFKSRRCIIPASGFYEWTDAARQGNLYSSPSRQPHLFTAADGSSILAFAGLWERWWEPETGEKLLSCTIIVSGASAWMKPYHDRMPILLGSDQFDCWLSGEMRAEELQPAQEGALREWPVSTRLNRIGHGDGDPSIVEAV